MENTPKPIKRSAELISLSREHHDGLLFVWKIRQGIRNGVDAALISKYCKWYWDEHLQSHFSSEEEVLVPYLDKADDKAIQLIQEHSSIRALLAQIEEQHSNLHLSALADAVDKHIRFEERTFFPYLESTLTKEQLATIAEKLGNAQDCGLEFQPEFWKTSKK